MDYLEKLVKKIALVLFGCFVLVAAVTGVLIWYGLSYVPNIDPLLVLLIAFVTSLLLGFILAQWLARYVTTPLNYLWRAILHVSPGHQDVPAPDLEKASVARELVTSLTLQIYQLASGQSSASSETKRSGATSTLDNIPVPTFVIDKGQSIRYANNEAINLLRSKREDVVNKSLYSVLDFSFADNDTYDKWLEECRSSKATATKSWNHVKLPLNAEQTTKQFDLAAFYTKDSPDDTEAIICLFDKTKDYEAVDDDIEFISLAVHELRTPLTMLRGYIEVFEEELDGKLDEELSLYMTKMRASAEQLTTFVSNILNVARVEENQLFLHLHEEPWSQTLKHAVEDMTPRAQAHGYQIDMNIQDNLPAVAVDKTSIYEVISNLLDNAIKYSTDNKKIVVRSYLRDDGLVETTIQDFGIGIPNGIIGHLFEKFYRNHRSRAQVGGTGLGLYLSKAIVNAHGGQIWVKSKEDEGSIFGFTLQQYDKLADELKSADNKDIRRTAYGWIKNHSFYRR